ncbi:protein-L-isoaspartate(D-aspartate) O-methyltransferase [Halorhodospira halochloris]|nr:protein-L-isoaspartate(D-aspartate) O-methyltransferase [Halorhodospira halochloris]MBK1651209.1 protein-L-isoaspartate O-methyltransferase [Halorhodospira halochloris]MCG5530722.1 protein-L-isoaspartate(D-aspartate) O-methyltransferase [Halorhodospira halochloris]MCG5547646.1 protein-L-isoaspartate(D-aspartate) O-methyltransferase [Halorhodospira halochloris]
MIGRARGGSEGVGMTSRRTRERLVEAIAAQGVNDARVLDALREVPRHLFIDEALQSRAYDNTPLPIGHGQTISQPWVVARMSELLLEPGVPERVLEIGTGSGYQAAILAHLVPQVYTVERIGALVPQARQRLRQARLYNVHIRHGDGYQGWPEYSPYDGIILTAAPHSIPEPLLDQLAVGGRMVAPIGGAGYQELLVIDKTAEGIEQHRAAGVTFVPMVHGRG